MCFDLDDDDRAMICEREKERERDRHKDVGIQVRDEILSVSSSLSSKLHG